MNVVVVVIVVVVIVVVVVVVRGLFWTVVTKIIVHYAA